MLLFFFRNRKACWFLSPAADAEKQALSSHESSSNSCSTVWNSGPVCVWTLRQLNSSYTEKIMAPVVVPLVLQGLFAVLIKQSNWWLCDKSGCVGILCVHDTSLFGREADRMPEAEHQSQRTAAVSTHATDPLTLPNIMTVRLIPQVHPALPMKRWEARLGRSNGSWIYSVLQLLFFLLHRPICLNPVIYDGI